MEKKGQKLNKHPDTGDELLDFDLDDLEDMSSQEIEQAFSEMDDDILELTDLVEAGAEDEVTQDMEVSNWLKESRSVDVQKDTDLGEEEAVALDQPTAEMGPALDDDELDLSDISLELNLEGAEETGPKKAAGEKPIEDSDLDFLTEEFQPGEETLDLTKEEKLEAEGQAADEIATGELDFLVEEAPAGQETLELSRKMKPEAEQEPAAYEIGEAEIDLMLEEESGGEEVPETQEFAAMEEERAGDLAGVASEDEVGLALGDDLELELEPDSEGEPGTLREEEISQPPKGESMPVEMGEEPAVTRPSGDLIALSEERIEAIITRVVGEVVERVARETMAEVAERVIGEAIEALRKSLESDSE
ncbi:MAG: hypothetical protein KKE57_05955 [Proteobacteria bacterium]|nr:hypothetical protein [Pseudomonadota bacterium]